MHFQLASYNCAGCPVVRKDFRTTPLDLLATFETEFTTGLVAWLQTQTLAARAVSS